MKMCLGWVVFPRQRAIFPLKKLALANENCMDFDSARKGSIYVDFGSRAASCQLEK